MAINICPLAADWGNLGDWAAVLIGAGSLAVAMISAVIALLGAAAVAFLAWQANRQVARQDAADSSIRAREADVLQIAFEGEVGLLVVDLGTLVGLVGEGSRYESEPDVRANFAERTKLLRLPVVEAHFDRLHVLPDDICYTLARLRSGLSVLELAAEAGQQGSVDQIASFTLKIRRSCQRMHIESRRLHALLKEWREKLIANGNWGHAASA